MDRGSVRRMAPVRGPRNASCTAARCSRRSRASTIRSARGLSPAGTSRWRGTRCRRRSGARCTWPTWPASRWSARPAASSGRWRAIEEFGGHPLLRVVDGERERLVPCVAPIVVAIDVKARHDRSGLGSRTTDGARRGKGTAKRAHRRRHAVPGDGRGGLGGRHHRPGARAAVVVARMLEPARLRDRRAPDGRRPALRRRPGDGADGTAAQGRAARRRGRRRRRRGADRAARST